MNKQKWICPICDGNSYQRYGGIPVAATRIFERDGIEIKEDKNIKMGSYFMCKKCTIFFANPCLFNKFNIKTFDVKEL